MNVCSNVIHGPYSTGVDLVLFEVGLLCKAPSGRGIR
jgi:hypothetical protein